MNRDTARPDKLAKQMFFLGLLGLPWLWVVNILYFFNRVFGSRIFCCGNSSGNEDDEDRGILGLMSENDEDDDENTDNPSQEEIEVELKKWVKRSTFGSFVSTVLLLTWVLVFQLNRDNFGASWFVYSPTDEVLTGW